MGTMDGMMHILIVKSYIAKLDKFQSFYQLGESGLNQDIKNLRRPPRKSKFGLIEVKFL